MSEAKATLFRWKELPWEPVTEQLGRRMVTGERAMIAQVLLEKGAVVPTHSHENEQFTYILEGALHFWLGADGSEEVVVSAGEVLPYSVPCPAQGGGAREDAGPRHLLSPEDGLAGRDGQLLPRRGRLMDLGIAGRVALVAASSKGLGRAVAEELAAEGAHLVMCARGEEALAEAVASADGCGPERCLGCLRIFPIPPR